MRDIFIERLTALAERDDRIMLVTGDLGFGVLDEYSRRFPQQFINAGVAEQNMTGLATGLALEGYTVFTYSIANFSYMRCLEQIRNDAAYHNCNIKVVSIGGGFSYGALGISHHATEDLSVMRSLPDVTVVSPCDDWEAAEATDAITQTPGTAYLRLDKSTAGHTQRPGERFEFGKARRLREGPDITLAATGGILEEVLQAADDLAGEGIHCRVLSVHTLKPLDVQAFANAARTTGGIVTVEEQTVEGGLGGSVAENLLETGVYPRCFHRIGLRQGFSSIVGSQRYLREQYRMGRRAVVARVKELLASAGNRSAAQKAA